MPEPIIATLGSAVSGIFGSVLGAEEQADGITDAADTSLQATRESIASQEKYLDKSIKLQEPFRKAGVKTLPQLIEYSKGDITKTPQFKLQQQEGEEAIDRAAAARGGFGSTSTVSKLGEFNRRLLGSESDKQYARLYDLVNMGQSTSTGMSAGMSSTAGNISTAQMQSGSTMSELAMLSGQNRGSTYASLGQIPGQTVNALTNAGAFNTQQQVQQPYQNPYVTLDNPLGLTPGQGMSI